MQKYKHVFQKVCILHLKFQVAFWRTFPVSRFGSTVFFQSALCSSVEWLFGRFLLVNIFGYFCFFSYKWCSSEYSFICLCICA